MDRSPTRIPKLTGSSYVQLTSRSAAASTIVRRMEKMRMGSVVGLASNSPRVIPTKSTFVSRRRVLLNLQRICKPLQSVTTLCFSSTPSITRKSRPIQVHLSWLTPTSALQCWRIANNSKKNPMEIIRLMQIQIRRW